MSSHDDTRASCPPYRHAESDNFERQGDVRVAQVLERAIRDGVLGDSETAAVFIDLTGIDQSIRSLRAAFPDQTLHTVAVKANPLVEVLKRLRATGLGAEVASLGELSIALAAGFPAELIVFDSPAKTQDELVFALTKGVRINANCLEELDRIAVLRKAHESSSAIGIRINPEVGSGSISATSVAVRNSKFGVPLSAARHDLVAKLVKFPWLTALHVHIGSQGMSLTQLVDGVGAVCDFYDECRSRSGLRTLNVGGGLPAKYRISDRPATFDEYFSALQKRCPSILAQRAELITEFGRAIYANHGWVASRIEYVLEQGPERTLVTHVGADMFLRKVYRPDDWHHRLSICAPSGAIRQGDLQYFNVAGPLCFAGDYLARHVALPRETQPGDYVLVHDAGAYTFSMWSVYNSRQFPAVLGYENDGRSFCRLRARQSPEDVVRYWSIGENQ